MNAVPTTKALGRASRPKGRQPWAGAIDDGPVERSPEPLPASCGCARYFFSTTRTPKLTRKHRRRAVEGQADLVDDARQAEQVPGLREWGVRIADEVARENVLGRVDPQNLCPE